MSDTIWEIRDGRPQLVGLPSIDLVPQYSAKFAEKTCADLVKTGS